MGENAGIEQPGGNNPQGQQQQQQQGTGQQNPQQQQGARPYDQYLQRIPEGLRPTVETIFQEWDGNTTRRFQELQNQLSGIQPYQPFIDSYEPEAIGQAISLAEALSDETSARQFFGELAGVLGYQIQGNNVVQPGQQQQQNLPPGFDDEDNQPDFFSDPRFKQIEEGVGTLAGYLMEQQQRQQEEALQKEVESEWNQLKEQNKDLLSNPDGSYNEDAQDIIFALAINNGGDLKAAVERYANTVGKQAAAQNAPGRNAPIVGGGAQNSMPSNSFDPKTLTPEQRKELALQTLRAANQQR